LEASNLISKQKFD